MAYRDRVDLEPIFSTPLLARCSQKRIPRWDERITTRRLSLETDLSLHVKRASIIYDRFPNTNTYHAPQFFLLLGDSLHDHLMLASSPLNSACGRAPSRS
jgi:hypothetical protein